MVDLRRLVLYYMYCYSTVTLLNVKSIFTFVLIKLLTMISYETVDLVWPNII